MNSMCTRIACLLFVSLGLLATGSMPGCQMDDTYQRPSVLAERLRPQPVVPGANDVLMSTYYVERPFGDTLLNEVIWASADDQHLDMKTLDRLHAQGFRVAVKGGALPAALEGLLNQNSDHPKGEKAQLASGTPNKILVSDVYETWPGPLPGLHDKKLQSCVAALRMVPTIMPTGNIDLAIQPEILHGDPKVRFVPEDESLGGLNWTPQLGRAIYPLDDLAFAIQIHAGQRIFLSCLPDQPDSLGAYFFKGNDEGHSVQRLIVIQVEAPAAKGLYEFAQE